MIEDYFTDAFCQSDVNKDVSIIETVRNKNGVKIYEIYDIYKVKPTDTEVLSQKTNGRTELTLITCSDYSSTRIIVKAFAK